MKYVCAEETCSYEGEGEYTIDLNGEACMDANNIASVFCPYCNSTMSPEEEALALSE
jgi:hypothetical protein